MSLLGTVEGCSGETVRLLRGGGGGSEAVESAAVANTLTDAQKSTHNALDNTIKDYLTEGDFSGTLRDLIYKEIRFQMVSVGILTIL
mgnify:CR=1 FL=1